VLSKCICGPYEHYRRRCIRLKTSIGTVMRQDSHSHNQVLSMEGRLYRRPLSAPLTSRGHATVAPICLMPLSGRRASLTKNTSRLSLARRRLSTSISDIRPADPVPPKHPKLKHFQLAHSLPAHPAVLSHHRLWHGRDHFHSQAPTATGHTLIGQQYIDHYTSEEPSSGHPRTVDDHERHGRY
jgi:hypothetical protein